MFSAVAVAAGLAIAASCRWAWWRPKIQGLPVLMYHKIGDAPRSSPLKQLWVAAADFRRQLRHLKGLGYAPLSFSELRDAELGKIPMPQKPVLITFDDGYANNHELAFPILKELNLKANIFLVCAGMGDASGWDKKIEPALPLMTWAQARELQDSGLIEFGSHTLSHRRLSALSLEDARGELMESKKRLEQTLGREIIAFAYPYGDGADRPELRRLAREAGYRYDFSIEPGVSPWPWDPDSQALARLPILGQDTIIDFHLKLTRGRAKLKNPLNALKRRLA